MANRNLEVTLKILDYFRENPNEKVRPLSLSNTINEDPVLVDELLAKCGAFFQFLPTEQAFILNKKGPYKGDVVRMKINAEDLVKEKNFFQKHWYFLSLIALVVVIYLILNQMQN